MGKGLLDKLIDSIFDEKWVGRHGESLAAFDLNLLNLFGRSGKVLRNVYLPKKDGTTTELDLIYLTDKGLFVLESKNYTGWIFGSETQNQWTVTLSNRTKYQFYNPIKQNKNHIKHLREYIRRDVPIYSIIVFSERCELKKVEVNTPEIKVIKRDLLYATIKSLYDQAQETIPPQICEAIYLMLEPLTNVSEEVKQKHIENLNKRNAPRD